MTLDAAFVSGLIAGEGCFSIRQQNGGQSRACAFALALRDDTELLQRVVSYVGCGRINPKRAFATSKPQVVWHVSSQADCLKLAEFLDGSLALSKKALEFEVWRRAVAAWTSRDGQRISQIDELAAELAQLRDPAITATLSVDINGSCREGFLAGFVTGEGHFGASTTTARFAVNLRSDDRQVLDVLAEWTGVGSVTIEPPTTGSPNPRASWKVNRRDEQRRLVAIFDRCPPGGRKGRTYAIWREGPVAESAATGRRGASDVGRRLRPAVHGDVLCRVSPGPRRDSSHTEHGREGVRVVAGRARGGRDLDSRRACR